MGGFWRSAVSALAKGSAAERGRVGALKCGIKSGAAGDKATVWQAWQAAQVSQWPSLEWLASSATWSMAGQTFLSAGGSTTRV